MDKKIKIQRALEKAAEFLEIEIDPEEIDVFHVTKEELMTEAQSIVNYYNTQGQGFKTRICDVCGLTFAYSYSHDGIRCCSIECMAEKLRGMGLKWDPYRETERRWGHYVPAIVPPSALSVLTQNSEEEPQE